jgi:hypothetical protein
MNIDEIRNTIQNTTNKNKGERSKVKGKDKKWSSPLNDMSSANISPTNLSRTHSPKGTSPSLSSSSNNILGQLSASNELERKSINALQLIQEDDRNIDNKERLEIKRNYLLERLLSFNAVIIQIIADSACLLACATDNTIKWKTATKTVLLTLPLVNMNVEIFKKWLEHTDIKEIFRIMVKYRTHSLIFDLSRLVPITLVIMSDFQYLKPFIDEDVLSGLLIAMMFSLILLDYMYLTIKLLTKRKNKGFKTIKTTEDSLNYYRATSSWHNYIGIWTSVTVLQGLRINTQIDVWPYIVITLFLESIVLFIMYYNWNLFCADIERYNDAEQIVSVELKKSE